MSKPANGVVVGAIADDAIVKKLVECAFTLKELDAAMNSLRVKIEAREENALIRYRALSAALQAGHLHTQLTQMLIILAGDE